MFNSASALLQARVLDHLDILKKVILVHYINDFMLTGQVEYKAASLEALVKHMWKIKPTMT